MPPGKVKTACFVSPEIASKDKSGWGIFSEKFQFAERLIHAKFCASVFPYYVCKPRKNSNAA